MGSEMARRFKNMAFVASPAPEAQEALARLTALYPPVPHRQADVIVALGGDGLMLQSLHEVMATPRPIYGMHKGTIGFLMNDYREDVLVERLEAAQRSVIHPLVMVATDVAGHAYTARAINEVSLLRETWQAAKLSLVIDGTVRMPELIADGVLVATPAGSTAYNFSVNGPILPLEAQLLALTPISAFRPRRWRGALLPYAARITVMVNEAQKRPVSAVADHFEFRDIQRVDIAIDRSVELVLLHDEGHSLEDRILREQFGP
jgi:NAD+ kinase